MKKYILYVVAMLAFVGCIKNDIPFRAAVPRITKFEVEGAKSVTITDVSRTIAVELDETTDIRHVKVTAIEFEAPNFDLESMVEENARLQESFSEAKDFTKDFSFTIFTHYEYAFVIKTTQNISREFSVDGQVGSSVIDAENYRVHAQVSKYQDMYNINITSMKLGPKDITHYSKTPHEMRNFHDGEVSLFVTYHNRDEEWKIFIEQVDSSLQLDRVDAWTCIAWVYATGIAGQESGFYYREKGASEWAKLSGEEIKHDGGSFSGAFKNLTPLTSYECYAYCGSEQTAISEFTTGEARQVPNHSFEVYSYAETDKYQSFFDPSAYMEEDRTKWWDSGNVASAKYGYVINRPDTEQHRDGKTSACLETKYAVVKLGAGNLFSGEFGGMSGSGLDGKVNFGRYWSARPQAVRFWVRYKGGLISSKGAGTHLKVGDYDECQIKFALGNWNYVTYRGTKESPVCVDTSDQSTFWDMKTIDGTIAYADLIIKGDGKIYEWEQVTLPLEYKSTSIEPVYIIISCAASRYGDYYEGSENSTLWIDKIEMIY